MQAAETGRSGRSFSSRLQPRKIVRVGAFHRQHRHATGRLGEFGVHLERLVERREGLRFASLVVEDQSQRGPRFAALAAPELDRTAGSGTCATEYRP